MAEKEDFIYAVKSEGHLITNKAGGSARKQAAQLRGEQPILTRLARLFGEHTDERAYRLGAIGEEEVGRRLRRLDEDRWLVLHDIIRNASGTNVDHVVIGPAGVFSLNTKHHPDAKIVVTDKSFRINGRAGNYLHVARHEAAKVAGILSEEVRSPVHVRPVIVVMGAELEVRSAPADVDVIKRKDLPKWFLKLPEQLSKQTVSELMRVAGRPSTWKPAPVVSEPTLSVKRWSRYGKTRLYVNDCNGKTLGYRDEATNEIHVGDSADLQRVGEALETHARHTLA